MLPVRSHQMEISTDHDVIAMRQEVRQFSRILGLGLIQQAKIATALSTVVRGTVAQEEKILCWLSSGEQMDRLFLEVGCSRNYHADTNQIEEDFKVAEARLLVDEVNLSTCDQEVTLSLRVWVK